MGAALLAAGRTPAEAETKGTAAAAAGAPVTSHQNVATAAAEPLVVHLVDARTGEMDLYRGSTHTRVRDRDLAARLAAAAR
ncbi:hypothetical protein ACFQ9X_33050 [Catenulispora yoronensis]